MSTVGVAVPVAGRRLDAAALAAAGRALAPAAAIVVVQQLLLPLPPGQVVLGLVLGLLTALLALGMALVYRANRILNFAQGDLGLVPSTLAVSLVNLGGLAYLPALGIGAVAAVALGAVVELAVIRRFFRAPRMILTVATIGLSQLLAFLALLVPRLWDETDVTQRIDAPFGWRLTLGSQVFFADDVLVLVLAPLALVAVAVLLRRTDVGVAVRASAERADRAALLGIPVGRLHTYVWALAALLSFLSLFLRAGVFGLPLGPAVGFTVLLSALAALTLGRLTHLGAVVASAVALGLLERGVVWNDALTVGWGPTSFTLGLDSDLLVPPVLGVVIVVALLVQRPGSSRADRDTGASWPSADEVRPVPRELRSELPVRVAYWAGPAAVGGLLLALPRWLGPGDTLKAGAVVIFTIVLLSIVVLTGWAGQVSLGQMGFVAVGAAVGAKATADWGLDLTLALPLAGLVGGGVAVLVGLPALRLRGLYLAVTTLAFALATTSYFLNRQFWAWVPVQRIGRPPLLGRIGWDSPAGVYYVSLGVLVLVTAGLIGIRRSRTGRALVALRENEQGAQAYGVPVVRVKLFAFALSGFLAAVAGTLLAHHNQGFSLGLVAPEENLLVFTAAVVGGLGSMLGAALGAVFMKGGQWFLPGDWRLVASALGVLVVLWAVPGGLGGLVYGVRDAGLRWVARRRGTAP